MTWSRCIGRVSLVRVVGTGVRQDDVHAAVERAVEEVVVEGVEDGL